MAERARSWILQKKSKMGGINYGYEDFGKRCGACGRI